MVLDVQKSLVNRVKWWTFQAVVGYGILLVEKLGLARRDDEQRKPNRDRTQQWVRKIGFVRYCLDKTGVVR